MERARIAVTKCVASWGLVVYRIGGTECDGETLSVEQANDLIERFNFEQSLFAPRADLTLEMVNHVTIPQLRISEFAVSHSV